MLKKTNLKSAFTISKIDETNLKKYNLTLKEFKSDVKKILQILFNLKEIQSSKIFDFDITRINFDIAFCNNASIKTINRDYRNKDIETDVITFSLFVDDDNSLVYRKTASLGQIIISLEMADFQKEKNNNSFKDELLTLTIHGILHLLGFDHLTKKDYDFVVGIQEKVLKEVNE